VKARLFTDGGSRGNPGPAASAYVLEADDGTVLDARGEPIGVATNNVAEYRALVAGLALIDLSFEAKRHERQITSVRYTAVRRELNELADRLVNDALDQEAKRL
jgi:ribonuclease HI